MNKRDARDYLSQSRPPLRLVTLHDTISRDAIAGETIVLLHGEYDLARKEELRHLLDGSNEGSLTLDMTHVRYIDSTFLNELVRLRQRDAARTITIVGASEGVHRLFAIVAMEQLFRFVG